MRYIRPTTAYEQFVASGVYTHYVDDQATALIEHWSIHEQPDGAQKIRVDMDGRQHNKTSLLIEAWQSSVDNGGHIERFDIHAYGQTQTSVNQVRATYMLVEGQIEVGFSINNQPRQYDEIAIPAGTLLFPGTNLFLGKLLAETAQQTDSEVTIFSPDIDFTDEATFVGRIVQFAVASRPDSDPITAAGRPITARHYQFQLPGADKKPVEMTAWVDDQHILLRCEQLPGNNYSLLTQYAHRPEPKT